MGSDPMFGLDAFLVSGIGFGTSCCDFLGFMISTSIRGQNPWVLTPAVALVGTVILYLGGILEDSGQSIA